MKQCQPQPAVHLKVVRNRAPQQLKAMARPTLKLHRQQLKRTLEMAARQKSYNSKSLLYFSRRLFRFMFHVALLCSEPPSS